MATKTAYAGFWLRFAAWIVDQLILGVAGFMLGLIVGFMVANELSASVIITVVGITISWLYFASMESSEKQASLGKMLIGLKVTDLNNHRISFARATGRYFSKILSGLILLIGYFMIGFTEKKQGLHDMIAGTLVVKK